MTGFFLLISFLFLLIEGSISSIPFLLVLFLCLMIVRKNLWVLPIALVSGVFLDVMQLHILGETSLFFVVFLFLVMLYERKYETDSLWFVLFASFLGACLYLFFLGYSDIILQSIVSCLIALIIYFILHIL